MKYSVIFLFTLSVALPLAAQQKAQPSPSIPPLPPGPLLKRTPAFCHWTVKDAGTLPGGTEQASQTATGGASKPKVIRQESVTKTGSLICEELLDDRGREFERWHVNGVQILISSGATAPLVFPDSGGDDIYTPNFNTSDFAGLDWISEKNYSGVVKVMGRDCLVFRGEVTALPTQERREVKLQADREREAMAIASAARKNGAADTAPPVEIAIEREKEKVPAVAFIDIDTRLPIVAYFGKVTRNYQYDPSPPPMLVLPPGLAGAQKEYSTRVSNLSALPAAP